MTQATTTAPQTFSSPIGAAAAAPLPPPAEASRATSPHWTGYVSLLLSLVLAIGGGLIGYEVHNTHLDDAGAYHADTLKDHETRLRTVEQLPVRITGMETRMGALEKTVERQGDSTDRKLDQILARPSH